MTTQTIGTTEQRDAVLKHHKAGRTTDTIATITGLSPAAITEILTTAAKAADSGRSARAIEGLVELPVDHVHPSPNNPREKRIESGRIRHGAIGRPPPGHLSSGHPLAERAKSACIEQRHSRGRGVGVGGIACGQCWEAVIRANEREKIHAASAVAGRCLICGTEHDPDRQAS